jgi:hypothetical protein
MEAKRFWRMAKMRGGNNIAREAHNVVEDTAELLIKPSKAQSAHSSRYQKSCKNTMKTNSKSIQKLSCM